MKRAVFFAVVVLFAASALAQVHGVAASVSSITPSNPTPGVAASVTSLGPHGYSSTPAPIHGFSTQNGRPNYGPQTVISCVGSVCYPTTLPGNNTGRHHRGHFPSYGGGYGGYGGYIYTPYYPAYTMDYSTGTYANTEAYEPAPEPEPPAPTIFERRPTTRPYARDEARYDQDTQPQAQQQPQNSTIGVGGEETTTLVFRDGHEFDIHNYAIVGGAIFNFDGTGPFKTQLAELDVPATVKLNEDRGVIFKVPPAK